MPSIVLLAWTTTKAKYKRTFLGPLWNVITVALGSLGIALLWGFIFKMDLKVAIPHITIGFMVWIFITGAMVDGLQAFVSQAPTLHSLKLPVCFFPLMAVVSNLIVFFHSMILIAVILIIFPPENKLPLMYFIPYFILTVTSLFFSVFTLAILNARFRDIGLLINSLLPMLFFLSPVIFRLDHLDPSLTWVIYINPLSYYVFSLRDPLTGLSISMSVGLLFSAFIVAQYLVLALLYKAKSKQIVHWI